MKEEHVVGVSIYVVPTRDGQPKRVIFEVDFSDQPPEVPVIITPTSDQKRYPFPDAGVISQFGGIIAEYAVMHMLMEGGQSAKKKKKEKKKKPKMAPKKVKKGKKKRGK